MAALIVSGDPAQARPIARFSRADADAYLRFPRRRPPSALVARARRAAAGHR
jgi:hypothetical protein